MDSIHEEALKRGVHPECFKAGPAGACKPCANIVMDIFGERYDNAPAEGLSAHILRDLQSEQCHADD